MGIKVMTVFFICLSAILYTITEKLLRRSELIGKNQMLWSTKWSFGYMFVLMLIIMGINKGLYSPWGIISSIADARGHILIWVIGFIAFHIFNENSLIGYDNMLNWKGNEFYFFCFFNPLAEEILFRGVILMSLLNIFPNDKYHEMYVMLSSLLFCLFHLNYGPKVKINKSYIIGFVKIFVTGNAIGYLVLLTKSLWMSIVMHVLLNLSASVVYNIRRVALIKNNNSD